MMLLTRAERLVANLAVEPLSNKEIAERLFVCERTVKAHLTSIYKKHGLRGHGARTQFVLRMLSEKKEAQWTDPM